MPVSEEIANVKSKATDFKPVPQGMYDAQVIDVTFRSKDEAKPGKYPAKDKFVIHLVILNEGEERGKLLNHYVSTSFNAGFTGGQPSKLYEFASALKGSKVDDKVEFNVNSLVGGVLRIVVKHVDVDGKTFANITEVLNAEDKSKLSLFTAEELAGMIRKDESEPTELGDLDIDNLIA